jgi:hypothetical protein
MLANSVGRLWMFWMLSTPHDGTMYGMLPNARAIVNQSVHTVGLSVCLSVCLLPQFAVMPVASGVAKVFFLFMNQMLFCLLTVSDPSLPAVFISSCRHTWAPPCSFPACRWSSRPALSCRRMGTEQVAILQLSFYFESVFRSLIRTQLETTVFFDR